jgi:hypothetical protein
MYLGELPEDRSGPTEERGRTGENNEAPRVDG